MCISTAGYFTSDADFDVVLPCSALFWPGSADGGLRLRESGLPVPGTAAPPRPTGAGEPAKSLRYGGGAGLGSEGAV